MLPTGKICNELQRMGTLSRHMYALSTFPSLDHSLWVAPKYCSTSTSVPTYFPTWHQYTKFSSFQNCQTTIKENSEYIRSNFIKKKKTLCLFHQLPTFLSLPYFARTHIKPLTICFPKLTPFRFFEKDFSTLSFFSVQVRLSLVSLTFARALCNIWRTENFVMVCYFLLFLAVYKYDFSF